MEDGTEKGENGDTIPCLGTNYINKFVFDIPNLHCLIDLSATLGRRKLYLAG